MPWADGDRLTPTNLNNNAASASSSVGFSTNTLHGESNNTVVLDSALQVSLATSNFPSSYQPIIATAPGGADNVRIRIVNSTGTNTGVTYVSGTTAYWSMAIFEQAGSPGPNPEFTIYNERTDIAFVIDGDTDYVGIHSNVLNPTAPLHVSGNTMRLDGTFTPASGTATGNQGDICWDANFVYVCTSTNSWKRAPLGSF